MTNIVIGLIIGAFITFYITARIYELRFRAGELGKDWNHPSIFFFAIAMAIIWPITLTWGLACRPTGEERKEIKRKRAMRLAAKNEREARRLGFLER